MEYNHLPSQVNSFSRPSGMLSNKWRALSMW